MAKNIVRCPSCDGFAWVEDEFTGESEECDWCRGIGYIYRKNDTDSHIPKADLASISEELEQLEEERMHELGYQGQAKKPWQQAIRKNTQLGQNPYQSPTDSSDS